MRTNSSKPNMLEAALVYASQGYEVIPLCCPNRDGECGCGWNHKDKEVGKAPRTMHGLNDASSDPDQIKEWWKLCPQANIGILTNRYRVLDFDLEHDGFESMATLEAKYGPLPRTRVHRTGGGGEHWIYSNPDGTDIRNAVNLGGYKGVDLRAHGGYIVAPPSLHRNGNRYEVLDNDEIAPAPEWLMEMATEKAPASDEEIGAIKALNGVPEGERDVAVYKYACRLFGKGLSKNEVIPLVLLAASRCTPPFPEKEALAKVESAAKHELTGEYVPLRSMADVEPKAVDWLWYPYIPLGKLTLLEGDPGEGKSWASQAIAAKVSLGELELEPANVLLASVEDDLDDTIRPRLDALEADLSRIHPIEVPFILDDKGFSLLRVYMDEHHPALFIIDPLMGFLGAKVDIHRANEVRMVMAKLAAMARDYDCAILLIRHLNKGTSKALYRGMGSIDFTASVRSILLAGHEGDNLSERALVHIKCNVAALGASIGYMLGDVFCWTGQSTLTATGILTEEKTQKIDEAITFLRGMITGGEPLLASDIFKAAKEEDVSERTLKKAKSRLHIKSGKKGGVWYWYLGEKKAEDFDQYTDNKVILRWPRITLVGNRVWVTEGGNSN